MSLLKSEKNFYFSRKAFLSSLFSLFPYSYCSALWVDMGRLTHWTLKHSDSNGVKTKKPIWELHFWNVVISNFGFWYKENESVHSSFRFWMTSHSLWLKNLIWVLHLFGFLGEQYTSPHTSPLKPLPFHGILWFYLFRNIQTLRVKARVCSLRKLRLIPWKLCWFYFSESTQF